MGLSKIEKVRLEVMFIKEEARLFFLANQFKVYGADNKKIKKEIKELFKLKSKLSKVRL
jgi:hypothetical protein